MNGRGFLVTFLAVVLPAIGWGQAVGPEFQVNSYTAGLQGTPSVTVDSAGNFVVVWGSGPAYVYPYGFGLGQDGDLTGVFGQRFDADGNPVGIEFQVNTYTTGYQRIPSAAMNGAGSFVVVWQSDPYGGTGQDGSEAGVFGQLFDSSGNIVGPEFQVNSYTTGYQRGASVAMDAAGNFVVVWDESPGHDGSFSSIFGQLFDSNGNPFGGEFQVNSFTTGFESGPSVAMDPNGNFVVVWGDYSFRDGSYSGVFGQRFDSAGNPMGGDFQVNTYTTGYQGGPSVGIDASGDFVVAWHSFGNPGQDGSSTGVFGQRFDSAGNPLGGEFQINTYTTGFQDFPSVAVNGAGNFVVVWKSRDSQDGSSTGVFGQQFDSNGNPVDLEFQVNTFTTGSQTSPSASMDLAGNFVVVWNSYYQDGDLDGIFGQRFESPVVLDPIPSPIVIGGQTILTGSGFTAGSVIKLFVARSSGPLDAGILTPSAWTPTQLTWDVDPSIPLGNGFGTVLIVNTDEGFIQSNTQSQLLYGDAADNIPTILSINAVALSPVDPSIPVANVETVVSQGAMVDLTGTGFNAPAVNFFTASGNLGPLFPISVTPTTMTVIIPAGAPTGPASFQVVNDPFTGNVLSNAVSAAIGSAISITSVSQVGTTVTAMGTGFSTLSVINFFNLQGMTVVNLGGLDGSGNPNIPLTFINEFELEFTVPAGAQSGAAFVQVLNPPFIPFASTGNDPDGAFTLAVP